MLHGEQQDLFDLSFCIPSECADRLQDGRADIGIVPVIEVARQNLTITGDTAITCRGPVRSILLISKVPFNEIRTLAADCSSRTSVVLSQVVLANRYGLLPVMKSRPPDLESMLHDCDAALIIGDPALLIEPGELPYQVLDLCEVWTEMTGLPMVFAVWAGHRTYDPKPFRDSLQFGLDHLEHIVATEHAARGISPELARNYLTKNIQFDLGPDQESGMQRFLEYATALHETEERVITA